MTSPPRRRPRHPMPDAVRAALDERRLLDAYRARPAYQWDGYPGCIARAQRSQTRGKRLAQMPDELEAGDVWMRMT